MAENNSLDGGVWVVKKEDIVIVYGLLHEHEAIRQNAMQIRNAINEPEAKFLQTVGRWSDELVKEITTAYGNVQIAMSNINQGLQQHFENEEKTLAPLIGSLLTKALGQEHRELLDKFDKARSLVKESNLALLSREELLARSYDIRNTAVNIFDQIESHVTKEDVILQLLRRIITTEL
jgi:hemerythrin-like domain-containing protein